MVKCFFWPNIEIILLWFGATQRTRQGQVVKSLVEEEEEEEDESVSALPSTYAAYFRHSRSPFISVFLAIAYIAMPV